MANRERGEMTLQASDQAYTLRLTTNACCELEDKSGRLTDDVVRGALKGSVRDLRWLVWASLQEHHSRSVKTAADAGDVIDKAGGVRGVIAQMVAFMAMNADPNQKEGDAEADPPSAQAVSGDVSSLRLAATA